MPYQYDPQTGGIIWIPDQGPPPTQPSSGGGSPFNTTPGQWSTGGPSVSNGGFNTGYPGAGGGNSGIGIPLTGGGNSALLQALRDAYAKSEGFMNQGLERLQAGQFSGGAFGGGAQNMFLNPQGMRPEVLQALRTLLTSTAAGGRTNAQRRFLERSNAAGFGASRGYTEGAAQIDAQHNAQLMAQLAGVDFQNEQYKLSQQQTAGPLAARMQELEAMLAREYANLQANRQVPIIEGGLGGGSTTGPGSDLWMLDAQGQVAYTPPGGWTPELYAEMQRQRMAYERAKGNPQWQT